MTAGQSAMPTVVLADADLLATGDLRDALERRGVAIVGVADSRRVAIRRTVAVSPDVLVTTMRLVDGEAFGVVRSVSKRRPGTAIVMLTLDPSEAELMAAIGAGASGYLPAASDEDGLARAIIGAADGDLAVPRRLAGALVRRLTVAAFGGRGQHRERRTKVDKAGGNSPSGRPEQGGS